MATSNKKLPTEYRPLSMWEYFGYNVLYSIPLIGWIFMIIFAIDSSNINRRNYTRSFFVIYIIWGILMLTLLFTGAMTTLVESIIKN
ncbi:MAG: ABC transporter permease [Candidatus Saccharimonadales bacterium]